MMNRENIASVLLVLLIIVLLMFALWVAPAKSDSVYMEKRVYMESQPRPRCCRPRPPRRCCGPSPRMPRPYLYQAPQNQINIGGDNFGSAVIINQN